MVVTLRKLDVETVTPPITSSFERRNIWEKMRGLGFEPETVGFDTMLEYFYQPTILKTSLFESGGII
jgi:hypothetical protein